LALAGLEAASAEAAGAAIAEAEPEAAAGAAVWDAAKADRENSPAIRAAISFFILVVLRINMLRKTILVNQCK
jgi:hypothetical protein